MLKTTSSVDATTTTHFAWHTGRGDISWKQALAWRMRRHHLIERATPEDLVEVGDRVRGLHAQVMSSVDLTLWAHIDKLERDAVAQALWRDRSPVKMWAMRATLYVLPATGLGAWIGGLGIWKPGTWPLKDLAAIPLSRYIDKALRSRILTQRRATAALRSSSHVAEQAARPTRQRQSVRRAH